MKKNHKFLIAGVVIVLAITSLVFMGVKESGMYFMTVTELKTKGTRTPDEGIRISGNVVEGSIDNIAKELVLKFKVKDEEEGDDNNYVNVYYEGVKPDSFKADVQVILEGKYNSGENLFKASTLLVKCPSRYEGEVVPEDYDADHPDNKPEVIEGV